MGQQGERMEGGGYGLILAVVLGWRKHSTHSGPKTRQLDRQTYL